jgi:hypothetical protein
MRRILSMRAIAIKNSSTLGIIITSFICGCADPVAPHPTLLPVEVVPWKLQLNHRAVTLSTTAPHNEIKLEAIAYNVYGDVLDEVSDVTYTTNSAYVLVSPDGTLRANTTQSTTAQVIAHVTYQGVTRPDTLYVRVNNNVPTPAPVLKTLDLDVMPGDSTRIASYGYSDFPTKLLQLRAFDTQDNPIQNIAVRYESSDRTIVQLSPQSPLLLSYQRGVAVVRASATVYGVSLSDSLLITVTDPLSVLAQLRATENGRIHPVQQLDHTIAVGGTVTWYNQSMDSVDIIFDDSTNVAIGKRNMRDMGGNIPPFASTQWPIQFNNESVRERSFPIAGTYHWRSTRFPDIRGTITVR